MNPVTIGFAVFLAAVLVLLVKWTRSDVASARTQQEQDAAFARNLREATGHTHRQGPHPFTCHGGPDCPSGLPHMLSILSDEERQQFDRATRASEEES